MDEYHPIDEEPYHHDHPPPLPQLPETITLELIPQQIKTKPQETVIISTEQARGIIRETNSHLQQQLQQQLIQQQQHQQQLSIPAQPKQELVDFEEELDHQQEQHELMIDDEEMVTITETTNDSPSSAGVHFLSAEEEQGVAEMEMIETEGGGYERKKSELLEYVTRDDGSVICKLCGELLASRTHWYRHKYKFHVTNMITPAPLFKCTHCNVFFKSRKGFIGHTSARHSDNMEQQEELNISIQEEVVIAEEVPKITRKKEVKGPEWAELRNKEEQLVAAIIDRVKKECEAQGAAATRRGYSRRTTVMMNSS